MYMYITDNILCCTCFCLNKTEMSLYMHEILYLYIIIFFSLFSLLNLKHVKTKFTCLYIHLMIILIMHKIHRNLKKNDIRANFLIEIGEFLKKVFDSIFVP